MNYLQVILLSVGALAEASDWMRPERTPPFFWALMVALPFFLLFVLALNSYLGLVAFVGTSGTFEAIGAGIVLVVLAEVFFLAAFGPVAIRIGVDGVGVKRYFRTQVFLPWASVHLSPSRVRGFGMLKRDARSQEFYPISPNQYVALRAALKSLQSRSGPA